MFKIQYGQDARDPYVRKIVASFRDDPIALRVPRYIKADAAAAPRPKGTAHVSGQELLDGLRAYTLDQYGPLARTVLEAWGVKRCGDFGEIVFNLIDYNVFSKTASDRREDFEEFYTFEEAFEAPFRPTAAQRRTRTGARLAASS